MIQKRKPSKRARRRVVVITGTRAEYGLLRSTMTAIDKHPRLELRVVVTGMHLLKKFGATAGAIERDCWKIAAKVPMQRGDDSRLDQADGLARGIKGIAEYLERSRADLVLVLGDRIEAMAGALAATMTGRCVAHIHGGDVAPGDVDDLLRHSITKLAHIHLAATHAASARIIRLGERPENVHVVGAPGLDDLYAVAGEVGDDRERSAALVLHHASGRTAEAEEKTMNAILRAVEANDLDANVIFPNSDRGHAGVIRAIERCGRSANGRPGVRVERSLPREDYLRLLMQSRVLVGNSSSGIIEAAAAGTPCVNVGDRQKGRLRAGAVVFDAGESYNDIRRAVSNAIKLRPPVLPRTPYGDGHAGERIAGILAETRLDDALRRKNHVF